MPILNAMYFSLKVENMNVFCFLMMNSQIIIIIIFLL